MKNKVVLITGCSSGIGRHAAFALKQRGYRVFASARKQENVNELIEQGLESVQLDLANSASIQQAVDIVLDRTDGKVYGLFNNGAYGQPGAVEDLSRDVLRQQFEVNLFGTQELSNLLIPYMREAREGRIVQNSSVLGFIALKYRGAYNASKFALEGLSDTLRMELDGSGVYVSLIEPGPITSHFRENAYQMFLKNIDKKNSAHKEIYEETEKRLKSSEQDAPFTLGPEAVSKKLIQALESDRPKPRYYVTIPTYAFGFLKRVLSQRMMERVLIRVSNEENKH